MTSQLFAKIGYRKKFYLAMIAALGQVPNPLATVKTLENKLALLLFAQSKDLSGDIEEPDTALSVVVPIFVSRGAGTADMKAFAVALMKAETSPDSAQVTEMGTISELKNAAGQESFGDNLGDVWTKLSNFDLIGAGQEVVDTIGDAFTGLLGGIFPN